MTARPCVLALVAFLTVAARAEELPDVPEPADLPEEFTSAVQEQAAASAALEKSKADAQASLGSWYSDELAALRATAVAEGNLDRVLAVDAEQQRVFLDLVDEEKAKLFYQLRDLRARYDRARTESTMHISTAALAGLRQYAVGLERLEKLFLQRGNYGAATVVRRARYALIGRPPTSAVAAAPSPLARAPAISYAWHAPEPTPAPTTRSSRSASAGSSSKSEPAPSTGAKGASSQGKTAAAAPATSAPAPASPATVANKEYPSPGQIAEATAAVEKSTKSKSVASARGGSKRSGRSGRTGSFVSASPPSSGRKQAGRRGSAAETAFTGSTGSTKTTAVTRSTSTSSSVPVSISSVPMSAGRPAAVAPARTLSGRVF